MIYRPFPHTIAVVSVVALYAMASQAQAACDASVPGVLTCTGTFASAPNPVIGSFAAAGLHTLDVFDLTADIVKTEAEHIIRASGLNTDFTANIDLSGRILENTATSGSALAHPIYLLNGTNNSISVTVRNGQIYAASGAPNVTGLIAWSLPSAGSGGDVTVWQQSDQSIFARPSLGGATSLSSAHGIFATSRSSGSVSVRADGDISADSFGIWANLQGSGGALFVPGEAALGSGGDVTVVSTGIIQSRLGSIAVSAEVASNILVRQSGTIISEQRSGIQLGTIGGDIDVEIAGSVTSASQATSVANGDANWIAALRLGATRNDAGGTQRLFGGGGNNTINITASGSLQSAGGIGEYAIIAMNGNDQVTNSGTIIGSVDLNMVCPRLDPSCTPLPGMTGGFNAFHNLAGGVFEMGSVVNVGTGMDFSNAGILRPAGAAQVGTVTVTGNFEQTASGRIELDLDAGAGLSDRINVNGSAVMAGTVVVNQLGATGADGQVAILSASGGVTDNGLTAPTDTLTTRFALLYPTANDIVLEYVIDLDSAGALVGLNANQAALTQHLDSVLQSGGSGALFGGLGILTDSGAFASALNQLLPEPYLNLQVSSLLAAQSFSRSLLDCRVGQGGYAVTNSGECLWADLSMSRSDQDATSSAQGFEDTSARVSAGAQLTIQDSLNLLLAGRYEDVGHSYERTSQSEGDRGHVGIGLSSNVGGWRTMGAMLAGVTSFDTTRRIDFGGFNDVATGSQNIHYAAGLAGASYRLQFGQWHISPQLDVMITHIEADSVSERDRNGAALGLEATNDTYFAVVPSIEFGGNFTAWSHAVVRPYLRAGLTFNTNSDFVVSTTLLDGPATGRFQTIAEIDEVMADVEAGVDLLGENGLNVRLNYDGSFGDTIASQSFGTRVGLSF